MSRYRNEFRRCTNNNTTRSRIRSDITRQQQVVVGNDRPEIIDWTAAVIRRANVAENPKAAINFRSSVPPATGRVIRRRGKINRPGRVGPNNGDGTPESGGNRPFGCLTVPNRGKRNSRPTENERNVTDGEQTTVGYGEPYNSGRGRFQRPLASSRGTIILFRRNTAGAVRG